METAPVPFSTQRISRRMSLRREILCHEPVLDGREAELGNSPCPVQYPEDFLPDALAAGNPLP